MSYFLNCISMYLPSSFRDDHFRSKIVKLIPKILGFQMAFGVQQFIAIARYLRLGILFFGQNVRRIPVDVCGFGTAVGSDGRLSLIRFLSFAVGTFFDVDFYVVFEGFSKTWGAQTRCTCKRTYQSALALKIDNKELGVVISGVFT